MRTRKAARMQANTYKLRQRLAEEEERKRRMAEKEVNKKLKKLKGLTCNRHQLDQKIDKIRTAEIAKSLETLIMDDEPFCNFLNEFLDYRRDYRRARKSAEKETNVKLLTLTRFLGISNSLFVGKNGKACVYYAYAPGDDLETICEYKTTRTKEQNLRLLAKVINEVCESNIYAYYNKEMVVNPRECISQAKDKLVKKIYRYYASCTKDAT